MSCKKCGSDKCRKNGFTGGKQRFQCVDCGCNYTIGDNRFKEETIIRKAMAIIMYAVGSCSIRFISRFLKVAESTISGYIKAEPENATLPEITEEIKEIEIDEMWHFIQKKLTKSGFFTSR